MNRKNTIKRFNRQLKRGNLKAVKVDDMRKARVERDIKAAMTSDVYKRYSAVKNFWNMAMLNIRSGDKGAIITGSWAMRRARLKQGIDIKDIIEEYEEFGSDTQQSPEISRLSPFQKGGSFAKLFTMFMSSQRQYLAKEINAVKTLFQKGGTSKANIQKVAKTIFIYHVILPVFFQMVANLFGFDDDDRKEYLRAMLIGPMNGLFIFQDMIDSIVRASLGMKVWDSEIPIYQLSNDLVQAIQKLDIGDIDAEDIKDALKELMEASNSVGIPTKYIMNLTQGVKDLIDGDIQRGLGLMLGWSEYHLKEKRIKDDGGMKVEPIKMDFKNKGKGMNIQPIKMDFNN